MRAFDEAAARVADPSRARPGDERPARIRSRVNARVVALAAVGGLTLVGLALRIAVAQESVFADELSTYWIATTKSLGDVISTVYSNAEITPPLSFVLGWLATQVDTSAEALRVPSLIAGTVTIPALYETGRRTAGRSAGVLAAAFATFAPFMIYYSAEARGYALMMACITLSLLSLLVALDTGRARWWVSYAVFVSAAMYTHYTCIFVLAAQLLWVLWARPDARRAALIATGAAIVVYLPWITGLIKDLDSPTTDVLSALQPFDAYNVRQSLEHWSIGYPYGGRVALTDVPGRLALIMLGIAGVLTLVGLALDRTRKLRAALTGDDRRVLLIFGLALATPVGAAFFSAVGSTTVFSTRNLAASWTSLALASAVLIMCAGPKWRTVAALLAVGATAIGGVKTLEDHNGRPHFSDAATFVSREAGSGDVVIDETAVYTPTPGPLSHLDIGFRGEAPLIRSLMPAERDHPFGIYDPVLQREDAARKAIATSPKRIFLVTDETSASVPLPLPRYRKSGSRRFPGLVAIVVLEYRRIGGS